MTAADFNEVLTLISSRMGLKLPESNYRTVKDHLEESLERKNLTWKYYQNLLLTDTPEYQAFVDAVTINETYFFREEKQFVLLDKILLPRLAKIEKNKINFWSAACSTGEEAWSLATLAEKHLIPRGKNYTVFATDLNPYALKILEKAEYRSASFREDGQNFHDLLKPLLLNSEDGSFRFNDEVRSRIQSKTLNLFDVSRSDIPSGIDVVFLRNMLIYVDLDLRFSLLSKIIDMMVEGGFLFLSSTEMPLFSHPLLVLNEENNVFYFVKKKPEIKDDFAIPREKKIVPVIEKISKKPDWNKVCVLAQRKLEDRYFYENDDINYDLAVRLLQGVMITNSQQSEEGNILIQSLIDEFGKNAVCLYLQGLMDMKSSRFTEALEKFTQSIQQDSQFWPSYYYRAQIMMKRYSNRARQDYVQCAELIHKYLSLSARPYDFLMEGFNPRYFLDICTKWMGKLTGESYES